MKNLMELVNDLLSGDSCKESICPICNSKQVLSDGTCLVCNESTEHEDVKQLRKKVAYEGVDMSGMFLVTAYGCCIPYSYEEHNNLFKNGIFKEIINCPEPLNNDQRETKNCKYCDEELSEYGCTHCDPLAEAKYHQDFSLTYLETTLAEIKKGIFLSDMEFLLKTINRYGSFASLNRFFKKDINYTVDKKAKDEYSQQFSYEKTAINKYVYTIVINDVEYMFTKQILSKEEQESQLKEFIEDIRKDIKSKWHVASSNQLKTKIYELKRWSDYLEFAKGKLFTSHSEKIKINRQIEEMREKANRMQVDLDSFNKHFDNLKAFYSTHF